MEHFPNPLRLFIHKHLKLLTRSLAPFGLGFVQTMECRKKKRNLGAVALVILWRKANAFDWGPLSGRDAESFARLQQAKPSPLLWSLLFKKVCSKSI
jgi:hypothetical protein